MNNKTISQSIKPALFMMALLLCSKAFAHSPTLSCEVAPTDTTKLYCQAGYSDASLAGVVELKVFSYDEELLSTITTATDGSAEVDIPEGEYYIVFDPKHEDPAEFDYAELE